MTDNELDQRLKSAPVPNRPEGYWSDFPKKVTAKLHWQSQAAGTASSRPGRQPGFFLAWGLGFAAVLVVIGLLVPRQPHQPVKLANDQLPEIRKCYAEFEALFPKQLKAIVFDGQGPHMILADKADVPESAPLYLKVCGPKGCEGFVTFSGQNIRVNGEDCEVLADAQGKVMLVGNHQVWLQGRSGGALSVEARLL